MAKQIIVTKDNYGIEIIASLVNQNKESVDVTGQIVEVVIVDDNDTIVDKVEAQHIDSSRGIVSIILQKEHTSTIGLYKTYWSALDKNNNVTAQEDIYYYCKDKNGGVSDDSYVQEEKFDIESIIDKFKETDAEIEGINQDLSYLHKVNLNAEVVDARGEYNTLGGRLDVVDNDLTGVHLEMENINASLDNIMNLYQVDLMSEGCRCDGITNDSIAFQNALNKGNIKLPYGKTIKLGNINVPSNRIIDLNGCTVIGSAGTIFKIGENTNSYFRDVIIKNGFIEPTIDGSVVNMTNCIDCKIENIKIPHLRDNSHGIRMINGFNNIFDKIWVMTSTTRLDNASGINIRTQDSEKVGVSNITNIEIKNCLIQNMKYGIQVDSANFSIDTIKIHNQGLSDCYTGIYFVGNSSLTKVCDIDVVRVENSDIGIDSNSAISLRNAHFYNTGLAINNRSNGRMVIEGVINFAPSVTTGIKNVGYGYFDKAIYLFDKSSTKFELNHHTRPWEAMTITNSSRNFTDYINPIFNTKINQATYFEFTDLPTINVQQGTEIIIYANGNWNPKIEDNVYYTGFKYGCLHLKFHDGKWKIIGDSNLTSS